MTHTEHTDAADTDASIAEKRDRLDEIVERLEDGEVSLERAHDLHAEGRALLDALREDLSVDDGEVTLRE